MWIKLIITIVTLFLLFDEYFKVIDKAIKKRNRRKIVLTTLAILSVFSLIDVIIEVNEGNELVEKANEIVIKSDTLIAKTNSIIIDLSKNIDAVENSGRSIITIDSVLKGVRDNVSNQVKVLDEVVGKSEELVLLEEKKFKSEQADILIFNNEVSLVSNDVDSSFIDIKFGFRNLGERRAGNIKFQAVTLIYNKILKDYQIFRMPEFFFSDDLGKKSIGNFNGQLKWSKEMIFTGNYYLIFIVKCEYEDVISKSKRFYKRHFIAKNLTVSDTKFTLIVDNGFANSLNKRLIDKNLEDYLILF